MHIRSSLCPPLKGNARSLGHALALLLFAVSSTPVRAQIPAPLFSQPQDTAWRITQRDFHSQVWESSTSVADPITGKATVQKHSFTTIGSGINFLDENGSFQVTREEFAVSPDGNFAIAQFGPAKLIVENNVNSPT